jgi:hypothetical protein
MINERERTESQSPSQRLSQLQVEEVFTRYPELRPEVVHTTCLATVGKTFIARRDAPPISLRASWTRHCYRRADVAVHSAKDLPYPLDPRLEVIALYAAFDTTDSLVSRDHLTLDRLPAGSTVGTSSPLRRKGLLALRPDLVIRGIRGCIEDRVQQVRDGRLDAAIVATCALKRLGMTDEISEVLPLPPIPCRGFWLLRRARA